MSDCQGNPLKISRFVSLFVDGPGDSVFPHMSGLSGQHIAATILKFQKIFQTSIFHILQPQILLAADRHSSYNLAECLSVLDMQSQIISFFIFVDQDLIGWVIFFENIVLFDSFVDNLLQLGQRIVIVRLVRLKDGVYQFGLEVFDAIVLLISLQSMAPWMAVNDRQNFLLELGTQKPRVVFQSLDGADLSKYHVFSCACHKQKQQQMSDDF